MEWLFETEFDKTPSCKKVTSTPCTKGKSKTPHVTFPSNITPVAVKQLFQLTGSRHLDQYTWTSSLATNSCLEESDVASYADTSDSKFMIKPEEESLSLFSSWVDEPGSESMKDDCGAKAIDPLSPVRPSRDSLSDLLKTPPSFRLRPKSFNVPKKRKLVSDGPADDILSGLVDQPATSCKETSTLKSSESKLADEETGAMLDDSLEEFVDIESGSVIAATSIAATSVTGSVLADNREINAPLATPTKHTPIHQPAFYHCNSNKGTTTPRSSDKDEATPNSKASSISCFKPVRPVREGNSSRRVGFFYPSSISESVPKESADVNCKAVTAESQETFRPRKIAKFSTPSKPVNQSSVADVNDSAYRSQTPSTSSTSPNQDTTAVSRYGNASSNSNDDEVKSKQVMNQDQSLLKSTTNNSSSGDLQSDTLSFSSSFDLTVTECNEVNSDSPSSEVGVREGLAPGSLSSIDEAEVSDFIPEKDHSIQQSPKPDELHTKISATEPSGETIPVPNIFTESSQPTQCFNAAVQLNEKPISQPTDHLIRNGDHCGATLETEKSTGLLTNSTLDVPRSNVSHFSPEDTVVLNSREPDGEPELSPCEELNSDDMKLESEDIATDTSFDNARGETLISDNRHVDICVSQSMSHSSEIVSKNTDVTETVHPKLDEKQVFPSPDLGPNLKAIEAKGEPILPSSFGEELTNSSQVQSMVVQEPQIIKPTCDSNVGGAENDASDISPALNEPVKALHGELSSSGNYHVPDNTSLEFAETSSSTVKKNSTFDKFESSQNLCPQTNNLVARFNTACDSKFNTCDTSPEYAEMMLDEENSDVSGSFSERKSCGLLNGPHAVGFCTASGSKINVSNTSLNFAKNMLDRAAPRKLEKAENVEQSVPSAAFSTASGKNINVSNTSLQYAKAVFDETKLGDISNSTNNSNDEMSKTPSMGFSTASGSKIKVSNTSLSFAKNMFEETGVKPAEAPLTLTSKKSCSDPTSNGNLRLDKFPVGFSTASGSKINISNTSLSYAKNMFEETEAKKDEVPKPNIAERILFDHKVNVNIKPPVGFSTASGSKINISNTSLSYAKNMFEETEAKKDEVPKPNIAEELLFDHKVNETIKPPVGFSTAGGSKINVSRTSLNYAKNMFEETRVKEDDVPLPKICNELTSLSKTTNFVNPSLGFSTANGANIKVSDSSLSHIKHIFDDMKADTPSHDLLSTSASASGENPLRMGFSTAKGSRINISETSLSRVKSMFAEKKNDSPLLAPGLSSDKPQTPSKPPMGFSTASGAKVKVTKDSLLYAKGLLEETQSNAQSDLQEDGVQGPNMSALSYDDIALSQRVPEQSSSQSAPGTCQTPPVTRRLPLFRSHSPLSVTPSGFMRNKSVRSKPYYTTPTNGGRKFTFGNKPFKPHTPDRKAIANRLASLQETPPSRVNFPSQMKQVTTHTEQEVKDSTSTKPIAPLLDPSKKSALFRKPTDYMVSGKANRQHKVTLRDLTTPTCLQNEEGSNWLTAAASAEFVFSANHITDTMRQDVQALCCEYDVAGFLTAPLTRDKLYSCFLMVEGVDPSLISPHWFNNHYKWIVWKLSSLQRCYSQYRSCLSPLQLIKQMKYRYEREIDLAHRSALKKIFEGDDLPSKTMVLLVSSLQSLADSSDLQPKYRLELSDGWYSIKATHDQAMDQLIAKGAVKEGTKLMITKAQLCGLDQACSPLSPKCHDARLRISTNSVRRARYFAKLGYSACKPIMPLSSLLPLGGAVSCLQIAVLRVYPIIYMEKSESGDTVFRSELKERQLQRIEAARREKLLEQELEKESRSCHSQEVVKRAHYTEEHVRNVVAGSELLDLVESSIDPEHTQMLMSERQREKLVSYRQHVVSERTAKARARVKECLSKGRQVTPLLKVKVAGLHPTDIENNVWTILTMWRPAQDVTSTLCEGHMFKAHNLSVSAVRGQKVNSPVLLSANRGSMFERVEGQHDLLQKVYTPRQLVPIKDMYEYKHTKNQLTDIDTAGMVIAWESAPSNLTVVFLADGEGHMIALNFWGGLKTHGCYDIIKEGTLLYFTNLLRSKVPLRYTLPSLTITELTLISSSSNKSQSQYLQQLSSLSQTERKDLVQDSQANLLRLATSKAKRLSTTGSPLTPRNTSCPSSSDDTYVASARTMQRMQLLDRNIFNTENLPASRSDSVPSTDARSRRALTAQFQSPLRVNTPSDRVVPPPTRVTAEAFDEDISDTELLACFSQSK